MKNNLNVYKYGYYSEMRCPKNWFQAIGQFFTNIKLAKQRAKSGFCFYDTWDESFIPEILINMLQNRIDNCYSFPAKYIDESKNLIYYEDGFETVEDWKNYLKEIIELFKIAEIEIDDFPEVEEAWANYERYRHSWLDDSGKWITEYSNKTEADIAKQAWLDASEKANKNRIESRARAFEMLNKWWGHIFD